MVGVPRITKAPKKGVIPPLGDGDRLTAAEFHRRYEGMPELKKAELINGVVYLGLTRTTIAQGSSQAALTCWLGYYHAYTPGTEGGRNPTLRFEFGENEPQPDDVLLLLPEYGGRSWTDENGYLVGAAELTAEISSSTVRRNPRARMDAFEQNGIVEYIVWRVEDQEIDWFILKRGKYQLLVKTKDGLYKSKVFPGLWLDAKAMIGGDMIKVLEVVQQGIASPEHRRFAAKLRSKKK